MKTFTVHITQWLNGRPTYRRTERHISQSQLELLRLTHRIDQGWSLKVEEEL